MRYAYSSPHSEVAKYSFLRRVPLRSIILSWCRPICKIHTRLFAVTTCKLGYSLTLLTLPFLQLPPTHPSAPTPHPAPHSTPIPSSLCTSSLRRERRFSSKLTAACWCFELTQQSGMSSSCFKTETAPSPPHPLPTSPLRNSRLRFGIVCPDL